MYLGMIILLVLSFTLHAFSAETLVLEKSYFENKLFYELNDQDVESHIEFEISNKDIIIGGFKLNSDNFQIKVTDQQAEITVPSQFFKLNDAHSPVKIEFTSKRGGLLLSIPFQLKLDKIQRQKLPALEPIKFCISQQKMNLQLCSNYFVIDNNHVQHVSLNNENGGRIIINNQDLLNSGELQIHNDQEYKIFAESGNGFSLEAKVQPLSIQIYDVQKTSTNQLKVILNGPRPNSEHRPVKLKIDSDLVEKLSLSQTNQPDRQFSEIIIDKENNIVRRSGNNIISIRHKLPVELIEQLVPTMNSEKSVPPSTYGKEFIFKGKMNDQFSLEQKNGELQLDEANKSYIWKMKIYNENSLNQLKILIKHGQHHYLGFYEIYKSHPSDFSIRISGLGSRYGYVLFNEFNFNQWFERFLNLKNDDFFVRRWGMSFKYFNSLNTMDIPIEGEDDEKIGIRELRFDLRYRFTPGVWGYEETQGLLLSTQDFQFGPTHLPILGFGWFWARSMPDLFDRLFNKLPFMNYTKWVDMEIIFNHFSLNPSVQIKNNMIINFHGKIYWEKNIFGEAGFGYKIIEFDDRQNEIYRKLFTFFGTLGLGYQF